MVALWWFLACDSRIRVVPEDGQVILYTDGLTGAGAFHSGDPIAAGSVFCLEDDDGDTGFECPQPDPGRCLSLGAVGQTVLQLGADGCDFEPDRVVFEVVDPNELEPRSMFPIETFIDEAQDSEDGYRLVTPVPMALTPPAGEALHVSRSGEFPVAFELRHPDFEEPVTVTRGDWHPEASGATAIETDTLAGRFRPTEEGGELSLEGLHAADWEVVEVADVRLHVAVAESAADFLAPGLAYLEARDGQDRLVKGVPVSWSLALSSGLEIAASTDDGQVATLSGLCADLSTSERTVQVIVRAEADGLRRSERVPILLPARPEGWEDIEESCPSRLARTCGCSARPPGLAGVLGLLLGASVVLRRRRRGPGCAFADERVEGEASEQGTG